MERRTFLRTGLAAGMLAVPRWGAMASPRLRRRGDPLRLHANENPLGPSPAALRAAAAALQDAHRYPWELRRELLDGLAHRHGASPSEIVLGTGSTEVLQMAVQAHARAAATFVLAEPTYEDVPRHAGPWDLRLRSVPLRKDHAHDVSRMQENVEATPGDVVVYVCNPNNPTGTLTPADELEAWIGAADPDRVTFVIDEAYHDYACGAPGYRSLEALARKRPGVVVTRTFSKVHGLAGLRLGYGLAHAETAARLRRLQSHNNANVCALAAARASLQDDEHVTESLDTNTRARQVVQDVLDELELACLPSHTSFVMHRIRGDLDAYIARMRDHGFLVGRPFPPLLRYNRLSLATPEDMARFADTLRAFRQKDWV